MPGKAQMGDTYLFDAREALRLVQRPQVREGHATRLQHMLAERVVFHAPGVLVPQSDTDIDGKAAVWRVCEMLECRRVRLLPAVQLCLAREALDIVEACSRRPEHETGIGEIFGMRVGVRPSTFRGCFGCRLLRPRRGAP